MPPPMNITPAGVHARLAPMGRSCLTPYVSIGALLFDFRALESAIPLPNSNAARIPRPTKIDAGTKPRNERDRKISPQYPQTKRNSNGIAI